ncbi:uncharacterized protein EI97DRAFT_478785 [Westerdykella ornata]|uniref:Uncharacterized protein n=1 Tax=Westerdykella ornata TaxID=318751 RepID=A0A6A6JFH1_WESOR|nr:uncharacterized protein EI97DRAFT_478785 [Westerdykella ornata]KAF2274376.1 hypothetical protein EI97DRAFT_478785 [Westerdykella ornata]
MAYSRLQNAWDGPLPVITNLLEQDHPMEFSAAPIVDTEPFPQYHNPADAEDASFAHCVLHCKHQTCQRIRNRAERRAKFFKCATYFSCACKNSSVTSPPPIRLCPATEITLDCDISAEEFEAFGKLDWDKDIEIRFCETLHFLRQLKVCDSMDKIALKQTRAFLKLAFPDRERLAATAEAYLIKGIYGYLVSTLTPLTQQSRLISPRMLKTGLANHMRLALCDWKHASGPFRHGTAPPFIPRRFKDMLFYDGIACEVWKA